MKRWNASAVNMLTALDAIKTQSREAIMASRADADASKRPSILLTIIIAALGSLIAMTRH